MQVVFDHAEPITPTVKTLWFRPERPVRYVAGQFTELHLPHNKADDRGIRRWFTLSSSPTEQLLAITTRLEPQGGSSFKRQLAKLRPGDKLHLADPMGDFVLPKDPTIPILFVAAGLGITPVRSMITWLKDKGEQRAIQLLYKASSPQELAFADLFSEYPLHFTQLTSKDDRLTTDRIMQTIQGEPLIYISGPEQMVERLYKDLQTKGINASRLVGDYFPGYNWE